MSKEKQDLKKDVKMFAQLYIATKVTGGNIQDLFNHETRVKLSSLAISGKSEVESRLIFFHASRQKCYLFK